MTFRKIIYFLLFSLLIILSIFPRATEVVNKNYVFGFDQGRDYLDVQKIIDGHKFTLIGTEIGAGNAGFKYIFHGPGYYYLLTIPYLLFRGDPYGGVVLMFILGITSIGLAFYVGSRIFGKFGGLIFGLLIAISPPLVNQSRFIWNSFPATLFIILVYYFIYKGTWNYKFLYLAAFFSAFIYNFELAIAIPLVLSVIFFSIFILKVKNIKVYILMILSVLGGFLPMFLFEARHGFLGLKSIGGYILNSGSGNSFSLSLFYNPSHLNAFMFNFRDGFPRLNSTAGEVLLFIIMLFSFLLLLKREKSDSLKKLMTYLFCLPFITYFILSFLRNAVWPHYLNHLIIGYLFIFTYVLLGSFKKRWWIKYPLILYFGFFIYQGGYNAYTTFFQDFPNYYGGTAKIRGKTDAIDYIYKDAKGKKFGLFIFQPPIYTYPFDYLLGWYAKKKYGYIPHQNKKGLFYLLIEKDQSQPWRDKGWMETVIREGKILETKVLKPSNFIIQKRYQE